MTRRQFITLLGGAVAAWPLAARAQQAALPVIGFLNTASPQAFAHLVAAFRRGLNKTGYVDGENVLIEYQWARGHYDQVADLAGQLVKRGVNVLAAFSPPAALAAKAATASIPIVIVSGDDPVKLGLIASLNRPSGNVTGVSLFTVALGAKRHELLHDLMPAATARACRRGDRMMRREFITLLCGAVAWPVPARAQQNERVRRIGMLLPAITNDDAFQDRIGAFLQGLQEAGWSIGRNVRIETRWASNNPTEIRRHAAELAALAPDVVVAFAASTVGAMLQATSSVPIVFPGVADPVAAGFVDSLARPGRNTTGFLLFEYGMAGKLLELLKEIAPGVIRAGVLRDPATASGPAQFGVIQAAAPSLRVEVSLINMRDAPEIEQAIAAFAHSPNNGLIVPASGSAAVHRTLIIMLAARHRLPAIYASRAYVTSGGLASYGPDYVDQFRRSASYVDRILKGEKPADLPVQAPTKYELVINLKSAKALALEVPPTLLVRADEVIE